MATGKDEESGTRAGAHPNPDPSIPDQQMQYLKIHIALGVRSMPVPQHRNVHAGHMVLTSSNFGFDMQSIMPWLLDCGGSRCSLAVCRGQAGIRLLLHGAKISVIAFFDEFVLEHFNSLGILRPEPW